MTAAPLQPRDLGMPEIDILLSFRELTPEDARCAALVIKVLARDRIISWEAVVAQAAVEGLALAPYMEKIIRESFRLDEVSA